MSDLYETDFHAWALQQADALRRRSANEVDWDNLQDEVESLGRSEQNELESRLAVLQTHLLKWRFQPELQSRSWLFTIANQRAEIDKHLRRNPSLRPRTTEALIESYPGARRRAAYEMAAVERDLPSTPPWTFDDAMTSAVEYDEHLHPRSSTRSTKE